MYTSRKLQDYENIHGGNSSLISLKNRWQKFVSIFTCNFANHTWTATIVWGYSIKKFNKPEPEQVK